MADDQQHRPRRRLPRGPHAPRPQPDEKIRKQGGADLQNGWLGRHGTLTLTDDRLVFVPTVLDTVLRAKRRQIPLDEITEVERWPKHPGDIPPGAKRPRVYVHTEACVYELMLPDMDAWFDAIQKVYALRAKRGLDYAPTFTREGVENLMMAEE
jgi:hypothetical protein